MATRIHDRFDDISDDSPRVGAHRAPAQRGRGWIGFAWSALAVVVLVGAGLFGLSLLNPDLQIRIPGVADGGGTAEPDAPAEPEQAEPVLDPTVSISVLNGTPTAGLATMAGDFLVEQGWDGAALGEGSRANAAASDVVTTTVFYSDPANEGAARKIIQDLGVGDVRLSNDYPAAPITVLLGADYAPPAG
jgi:hypothetical protein